MAAGSDSIEAAAQGAPIHAVWVDYRPLDTVCIARKTIKTIKDLIGKNVGSTGAGGFAATTMGACLAAGGVSSSQVHEITMTRAEFVPSLASGRIAAAVFHADTAYTILHSIKLWSTSCPVPKKSEAYTAKILLQQGSITSLPAFSDVYDGKYCRPAEKIASKLYK
jgi:TRAP-type uncharacterized transport system substrate-binding protein